MESEIRAASFAPKIAWDIVERRKHKLHTTICGSLGTGDMPSIDTRALPAIDSLQVELRGLFSGNVNVGRLYLRAYPECRNGENLFKLIQRALGRKETDLYVVGLYNLTDHLDAGEAHDLGALVQRWWDRPLLRMQIDHLWLMGAKDDLVLESRVVQKVLLGGRA